MKKGRTRKQPSIQLPSREAIDDACITIAHAIDMLVGEDLYYHKRIRRILELAGFSVRRLERDQYHPVWVCSVRFGNTAISTNRREAAEPGPFAPPCGAVEREMAHGAASTRLR